jgi:hypothetical protein
MPEASNRRNTVLWAGCLLTIVAVLTNGLYFLRPPAQAAIPWLNLGSAVVALLFLLVGLRRAYTSPPVYRGKVSGTIFAIMSMLLLAGSIFGFFVARKLPSAGDAPRIGQKVPDFTLPDTNNQPVALAQLLAGARTDSAASRPKAVLLIFYRGYW